MENKEASLKRRKTEGGPGSSEAQSIIAKGTSKQQLAVRTYLEQTVVPSLLLGMTALVKARPETEDPLVWLGNWLLDHAKSKASTAQPSPAEKSSKKEKATSNEASAAPTTTTTTTTTTTATDEAKEEKTDDSAIAAETSTDAMEVEKSSEDKAAMPDSL